MDSGDENYNSDVQVDASDNEISDSDNDQVSVTINNEDLIAMNAASDADDSEVQSQYNFDDFTREGLIRVGEAENEFLNVKARFLYGMGSLKPETTVISVHKCLNMASITMQARMQSFRVFTEATARKHGGQANLKRAWFGASRDEICQIVSHGFNRCTDPKSYNEVSYGVGIYLAPNFSLDSALSSVEDETGLRHMLMCRVNLGKVEEVNRGSMQIRPSCRLFDSGVDSLIAPTKFIIWGAHMNSHILPEYLISFKCPGITNIFSRPSKTPRSPWMSFPNVISTLARSLHPARTQLALRSYNDFRAGRLSRPQMILRLRQLAGDELLKQVIEANPMDPPAATP